MGMFDADDEEKTANEWLARLSEAAAGTWANELTVARLSRGLRNPRTRDMMALALMDPTLDAPRLAAAARDTARLAPGAAGDDMLRRRAFAVRPDLARLRAAHRELSNLARVAPDCAAAAADLCTLVFWLAGDRNGLDQMLDRPAPESVYRVVARFGRDHDVWPGQAADVRRYSVPAI